MFKRKRPDPRPWSRDPRIHLDIAQVAAARAIYAGVGQPVLIRVTMTTTDGQVLDFELPQDQAVTLLEQLTYAYRAGVKAPRTRTETFGL